MHMYARYGAATCTQHIAPKAIKEPRGGGSGTLRVITRARADVLTVVAKPNAGRISIPARSPARRACSECCPVSWGGKGSRTHFSLTAYRDAIGGSFFAISIADLNQGIPGTELELNEMEMNELNLNLNLNWALLGCVAWNPKNELGCSSGRIR